jgi:L-fuconolactonase
VIDAHFHLWKIGHNGCVWPTSDLNAIYQDFDLDMIQSLAAACDVTAGVLVQSQEDDRDTEYLLELAENASFIRAVVGWVDMMSPSAEERILYLKKYSKFKGLRPMLQSLPEDDWILKPELDRVFDVMKHQHLSFDALVKPRHLVHICELARRHPDLPIVIDHAAKPPIAEKLPDDWCKDMRILAEFSNVHCKISGLVIEANLQQSPGVLSGYIQFLLSIFGSHRLMWGSDWPVIKLAEDNLAMDYSQWLDFAMRALENTSVDDIEHIFTKNAAAFYPIS